MYLVEGGSIAATSQLVKGPNPFDTGGNLTDVITNGSKSQRI